MVGIPTANEFMKHKEEFDAKIDGSDDLDAGLLPDVYCTGYILLISKK